MHEYERFDFLVLLLLLLPCASCPSIALLSNSRLQMSSLWCFYFLIPNSFEDIVEGTSEQQQHDCSIRELTIDTSHIQGIHARSSVVKSVINSWHVFLSQSWTILFHYVDVSPYSTCYQIPDHAALPPKGSPYG